jgi:nifR3 family TIM-barrel protein
MRDAALFLESIGVSSVDINMGCPVRKVCKVGGGSAMMTELDKTAKLVRGMVDALKIPVTAKMRLGWDDENLTAPDLVRALEDAGIAAVFIHGRTRAQGFGGTVNLSGIQAVVAAARKIPVIGNGDVTTPDAAKWMIEQTGCAGVSIGRGAFYDPWIFLRTRALLGSGVVPPEVGFPERIRVLTRHLERMIEVFGETHGCIQFRKVAPWYAKRFGPVHEFNKRIVQLSSLSQFHEILEGYLRWRKQFCDDEGELLPRFRPPPMMPTFMSPGDPESTLRTAIPVPKGPVEVW